jgi:hypothetical protein
MIVRDARGEPLAAGCLYDEAGEVHLVATARRLQELPEEVRQALGVHGLVRRAQLLD